MLPSIVRRRPAKRPALVCAPGGATPEAIAERIPDVEAAMRVLRLPLLLRVRETGFRRYAIGSVLAARDRRPLVVNVSRGRSMEDRDGDGDGNEDDRGDGDTVSFLRDGPERPLGLHLEGMDDMLWGLSSRSGVIRDAGALLASALGALRSFASGEGVVDHSDAVESCRLASLHWSVARLGEPLDPSVLAMLGPPRTMSSFPMAWSLRIDDGDIRLRPVLATADPREIDALGALRAIAGAQRIMERARALGIEPEGEAG